MILSKKSRYGLCSLIDLAMDPDGERVALASIAKRNGISAQYLEQIFASLRRAGIVRSIKGPQGGYLLGRNPNEITIAQILEALDGSYHIADESVPVSALQVGIPKTIQTMVIDRLNSQLDQILGGMTLQDLVEDYRKHHFIAQDMYYI